MAPVTDSIQAAIASLRQGDLGAARAMLDRLVAREPANADVHALIAGIERKADNPVAERQALNEALRLAPRHLGALLARGDLERRGGDARGAVRFFTTALAVARAGPTAPQFGPALADAQRFVAEAQGRFTDTLATALADAGLSGGDVPPRVAEGIDMMLGRRRLYVQQPSMFYLPGLAQRPFFDRNAFAWAAEVEAAAPTIRSELVALLAGADPFQPYVRSDPRQPAPANHLLDDPDWGALHLMENGRPHPVNAARCPATMAALARAPQPRIGSRSPMALFSRLAPGTHIAPHHGVFNTRLICHLPLIVPDGCAIRVGGETRAWREGELLIFDDSFEHEAWNRGVAPRTVLLFEIWRPDIDADERAAITTLLEAAEAGGIETGDAAG